MSLFSPSAKSFGSNFEQDSNDKKLNQSSLPNEDIFADIRHDFSKIFHDNNLDAFTNGNHNSNTFLLFMTTASDIGIPEFSRMPSKSFEPTTDDTIGFQTFNRYSRTGGKEEIAPQKIVEQGISSSPIRLSQGEFNFANFGSQTSGRLHTGFKALFSPNSLGLVSTPFDTAEKASMTKEQFSQELVDTYANDPITLMWSDDKSRGLKNITNQPINIMSQNTNFGYGDSGFMPFGNNSQESNRSFIEHLKTELFSNTKEQQDLSAPIKRSGSKSDSKVGVRKLENTLNEAKTPEITGKTSQAKSSTKKTFTPNSK